MFFSVSIFFELANKVKFSEYTQKLVSNKLFIKDKPWWLKKVIKN